MNIKKINVNKLNVAEYNPRIDLRSEHEEYQNLKTSIEKFGYIEPIVWNERTGNVVGGHQRLKILIEQGAKDIECTVVNIDNKSEKVLNIIFNKVKGHWDFGKLTDILQELNEAGKMDITGFKSYELQDLITEYDHINDLIQENFSDYVFEKESDTFVITFSIPSTEREIMEEYLKNTKNAKLSLAEIVINKIKGQL